MEIDQNFWMGTETSYNKASVSLEKYNAHKLEAAIKGNIDEEQDDTESHLLQVSDGVGIITVHGSLMDGEYGRMGGYFGVVGYGDIQKALVAAVRNADVGSIMLVIKSGGGAVSGVSETARFIESVDKVKPVVAFSPSTMASAALWLGLAARTTYVASTAIAGSIGTITVLASEYRRLQEDGIDTAVVRSGAFKALGHPAEPLTEAAIADTQKTINYLSDIFLAYVAERRRTSPASADSRYGQGRTFVGAQAVQVGLVDGVTSYTQAFFSAKALYVPDNSKRIVGAAASVVDVQAHNAKQDSCQASVQVAAQVEQKDPQMKNLPTEEQLAAMAAGVDLSAEVVATAAAVDVAQASTEVAATSAAVQVTQSEQDLQAELTAARADAEAAQLAFTAQLSEMSDKMQAAEATHAALADIVRASVKTMALPFNLDTGALAELGGADLVAKHTEISGLFKAKIKAGAVAAATRETKETAQKQDQMASVNPLFLAAAQLRNKGK